MKNRNSAYIQFISMSFQTTFIYRYNVIFQVLGVLFQIYLLKTVWMSVYLQKNNSSHINLNSLICYLTLANLQTWLFTPTITDTLQQRIRTGDIALDIAKPVNFIRQLSSQQFGSTLSLLPFLFLAFPLALLVGGMQLPASLLSAMLYIISLLFAYLIASFIGLLMGLISFWTFEITGIQLIYRFVNQLFAGALIPLSLFPPAIHAFANFLPFQAIAFLPVSIYLGQLQGIDLFYAFLTQLFWAIVLYLLVQLVWHRAKYYVMVQGG